jgi:hypothetical protein
MNSYISDANERGETERDGRWFVDDDKLVNLARETVPAFDMAVFNACSLSMSRAA